MKISDIEVGATYVNRGAGKTRRKVLAIGREHAPMNYYNAWGIHPDETAVLYEQKGIAGKLYISSFAKWAGSKVAEINPLDHEQAR